MTKRFVIRGFLLFSLILTLSSCGYHVAGRGAQGSSNDKRALPGGVKSLSIAFFDNNTKKPGVEGVIASALVGEFISTVDLVKSDTADAVLSGTINSYNLSPVSFTGSDVIQEYRLLISLSVKLVRRGSAEIFWQVDSLKEYEDYVVDINDIAATREAEDKALGHIATDIARIVKERILEDY